MKMLLLAATVAVALAAPASAALITFEGFSNNIYNAPIVREGTTIGNVAEDEQHFHEIDSTAFSGFVVSNGTGVFYNDRDSRIEMTQGSGDWSRFSGGCCIVAQRCGVRQQRADGVA